MTDLKQVLATQLEQNAELQMKTSNNLMKLLSSYIKNIKGIRFDDGDIIIKTDIGSGIDENFRFTLTGNMIELKYTPLPLYVDYDASKTWFDQLHTLYNLPNNVFDVIKETIEINRSFLALILETEEQIGKK